MLTVVMTTCRGTSNPPLYDSHKAIVWTILTTKAWPGALADQMSGPQSGTDTKFPKWAVTSAGWTRT